jgi:hypothetical protein
LQSTNCPKKYWHYEVDEALIANLLTGQQMEMEMETFGHGIRI